MAECILGPVRISFPNLFTPVSRGNDERKKYSVTILVPKDNKKAVSAMQNAIKKAELEAKDKKFGGKLPPKVKNPIWDGDGLRDNGEEFGPECKGHWVFTASTNENNPPDVLAGRDGHPATPDEIYAGCYGYVSLNFAGYNFENTKKGIGAYLKNFWKTKEGEPLAGRRTTAHDDFDSIIGEMEFDDADDVFDLIADDDEIPF